VVVLKWAPALHARMDRPGSWQQEQQQQQWLDNQRMLPKH
jgi:hypothetical protein